MNFRLTAILFGAVLVLGLVLLGLAIWGEDEAPASGLLLADLAGAKADQITALAVERPDGSTLKFERAGKDGWRITEPVAARADSFAVSNAVSAVLGAKPTTYGELQNNPAVHGLDKPLRVTLYEGDKSATINVGDVTIGGAKAVAFVNTPARPRVVAVPRAAVDALLREAKSGSAAELAKWAPDYRAKAVFGVGSGFGGDDVSALNLALPNKKKDLALTKAGGGWQFAAPAGWGDAAAGGETSPAPAGAAAITGVRPLVGALTGLQAGSAADFITDPKDLKEYGLNPDNPDLLRVELKGKDGPPEVVFIGKPPAPPPPAAGAPPLPPSNTVYVRVEGTPGVIRVTPGPAFDGVAAVVNDPTPLRDRDLLKDDLKARTDAIDITVGKDTVKLRKVGGEWKLFGGPGDPQPAGQKAVADLLALLGQPRLVKDFPARNDARFAPPEVKAEVKLWADAVEPTTDPKADPKAEPKLRAAVNPTVLVFGARDPAGTYVRRTLPGGAQADFVLPDRVRVGTDPAEQDVVAAAGRRRLDLLDPTLKRFPEFLADRLTIAQGGTVTLEVAREKSTGTGFPEAKWAFVKPDDRKGRPADAAAVGDLLRLLSDTAVGRFAAEQPTRDDLVRFGLLPENPRLKATVGLDSGPLPAGGTPPPEADKQRVYDFGNETEDKQSVYARVGGREAVFTVPKATFERLAGADVRDRTVAAFDPAKVKGVTVRGWKEATGAVVELAFERKPGGWAVGKSSLPGFDVAPAKVDEFVRAVRELRVKGDLPPGRLPKYRFPPEEGGFEITLDRDGEPPVVLDLGATVESGDRAAVLGKPGAEALFTLPADALKAYREGTKAFAR